MNSLVLGWIVYMYYPEYTRGPLAFKLASPNCYVAQRGINATSIYLNPDEITWRGDTQEATRYGELEAQRG